MVAFEKKRAQMFDFNFFYRTISDNVRWRAARETATFWFCRLLDIRQSK